MNIAMMIVDMQLMPFVWKDYGGEPIYNEHLLLENTQRLIEKARKANVPIYYILYTEADDSPRGKNQPLWQVHPLIAPQDQDCVIVKYFTDSFLKTDIHSRLQNSNIDTVVVCGVQTEYCIDTTVKSAYSHGYNVILAEDAHSTFDSDLLKASTIISHHNAILSQFADIVPSEQIEFV